MTARVGLVLLSVVLHGLAFPPWDVTVLAWVALVPLLLALRGASPGQGLVLGLVWGTGAIWAVAYWVPAALVFYYQQPAWFGVLFCVVGSVVLWGSYYGAFGLVAAWAAPRCSAPLRVLVLAVLWIPFELARARLLTGEPWMLLGYALVPWPAALQVAELGGVYLVSFVVVLVNVALAEIVASRPGERTRLAAAALPVLLLLGGVFVYGHARLATPLPASPSVPVVVVQGNNSIGSQWREELYGVNLDRYLEMSLEAARSFAPRLIVWPESAATFFLGHEPAYRASIASLLRATGAELVVGAPHHERDEGADYGDGENVRYFNSAFHLASDGTIRGRYDKQHLLPFAEYFPLQTIHFLRRHFARVRSFSPGGEAVLLDTVAGRAAVVICFEAIFPELVREMTNAGAELLITLSNDAWLGRASGPEQHLSMAVLRAVESRVWTIRATTTGISAIIDPFGRVVARSATFVPAVLEGRVAPLRIETPYERFGDAFAYGCVVVAALALLVLGVRPVARTASEPDGEGTVRA